MNEPSHTRGRWTIRWQPYTAKAAGGWVLDGEGPWPGEEPVPVVPVPDEQAVERGDAEHRLAIVQGVGYGEAFRRGLAVALGERE